MQSAIKAQFSSALFKTPHAGLVQVSQPTVHRTIRYGENAFLHPEKLLWIDTTRHIAVLTALLLPKFSHADFKGRLVLGFRIGQTRRQREYIVAPFDESGNLGAITPVHSPIQRIIFGRDGLMHKAFHSGTKSHFISHTPNGHESISDLMGQVGPFTSDKHLEIGFETKKVEVKSISPYGVLAIVP